MRVLSQPAGTLGESEQVRNPEVFRCRVGAPVPVFPGPTGSVLCLSRAPQNCILRRCACSGTPASVDLRSVPSPAETQNLQQLTPPPGPQQELCPSCVGDATGLRSPHRRQSTAAFGAVGESEQKRRGDNRRPRAAGADRGDDRGGCRAVRTVENKDCGVRGQREGPGLHGEGTWTTDRGSKRRVSGVPVALARMCVERFPGRGADTGGDGAVCIPTS